MPSDAEPIRKGDELASRRCEDCSEATKPLPAERVAGLLWQLDGWECVRGHHLTKTFAFRDFAQGLAFVNRLGALAESEGHHPDLFLKWGQVRVDIHTHRVDGLTESDFVLAAKVDRVPLR
jgi:4a-hydroxytetrahydrobiopterin dehydratase